MSKIFVIPFFSAVLAISPALCAEENASSTSGSVSANPVANYDETMKSVTEHISHNEFQEAITLLNNLDHDYPDNRDLLARRAALFYWTGAYDDSKRDYEKLYFLSKDPAYRDEIQKVNAAQIDKQCREKKNFVSLQKEVYTYHGKQPVERDTTLQAGFKVGDQTWIASGAMIDRYNTIDRQFGAEVYSPLGAKGERRWGYLAYYYTPSPSFLPQWDLSGGIYQGIFEHSEISLGYRHMSFKNKGIDIYKPGISFPLPLPAFRLGEELYWVQSSHSYSVVSTVSYDPSCKFHAFYAFTTGNSAETFRDENDIRRVNTRSHTLGASWRFDPSWALSGEITDTHRSQLYDRTGGKIMLKYFW